MGRSPCCDENGLKKGPWTPEEDQKLVQYIQKHGHGSWRALPKLAGLNRCGKSCRLRWTNYLRPDIKRGKFTDDEEQTILHLHSILGNKWSAIATHLPGRTDNEIKNFWNTHLKKKLIQMGFDPMTHQPRTDLFSSLSNLLALANLRDLIIDQQYHNPILDEHAMRLQADAVHLAKIQYLQHILDQPPVGIAPILPNQNGTIPDMELLNIINSISCVKENPLLLNLSQLENSSVNHATSFSSLGTATSESQPLHNQSLLSHLSDPPPHVPFSFQPCLNNNNNNNENLVSQGDLHNPPESPWLSLPSLPTTPCSAPALPPTPTPTPPSLTETSVSLCNPGDASSTTSGGGGTSSYWPPEIFFEGPAIIHDLS